MHLFSYQGRCLYLTTENFYCHNYAIHNRIDLPMKEILYIELINLTYFLLSSPHNHLLLALPYRTTMYFNPTVCIRILVSFFCNASWNHLFTTIFKEFLWRRPDRLQTAFFFLSPFPKNRFLRLIPNVATEYQPKPPYTLPTSPVDPIVHFLLISLLPLFAIS